MMDRNELLDLFTTQDIIDIMMDLGSCYPIKDNSGALYFTTICHEGETQKLHFFPDSKMFMCYTQCGSMSLYDVLSGAMGIDFTEAYKHLARLKGVNLGKRRVGIQKAKLENDDLEFLDIHLYKPKKQTMELPTFSETVMNVFDKLYPLDWYEEGISEEVAEYFDIRYYRSQNRCIIPHRDINGGLVGIRARSYNSWEVNNGKKYMPITLQGLTYRYPMAFNLYGLYQNQHNIRRHKRVLVFESEKSVLKYGSMYGQDNNITVALSSMNMSLFQRDLLLSLGIVEIVFVLDREYTYSAYDAEQEGTKEHKQATGYFKKLRKLSAMFINYCNVSVVLCWDERIKMKDCAIDVDQETFEELYSERYLIDDLTEFDDLVT